MEIGYNHPLFILPFDHRGTFIEKMFGIHGRSPNLVESSLIRGMKQVVYDAFVESLSQGVPRENAGILVDEQFGTEILKEARGAGFHLACPVEKSGQEEFDFEYGEQFGDHLVAVRPDFAKALVRYNSASDPQLNERQLTRLRRLADFLHAHGMRLMFELIVPPLHVQLKLVDGLQGRYDAELRPSLTRKAMQEIQEAGVEPDLWK
ncbi:MAG: 2-deoxy-5-keto-D-gluconate 6-phosphate aldolase domain-containing protein, partial [Bdellovibrionota bacterium]